MPLTHQKVTAILKKAGHVTTGRMYWCDILQGYRYEREGFRVWGKPGKPVTVEHQFARKNPDDWRQIVAAKTLEYASTLRAAGIAVKVVELGGRPCYLECSQ